MDNTPTSRMMALLEENNEIVCELAHLYTKPLGTERGEMIRTRTLILEELKEEIHDLIKGLESSTARSF